MLGVGNSTKLSSRRLRSYWEKVINGYRVGGEWYHLFRRKEGGWELTYAHHTEAAFQASRGRRISFAIWSQLGTCTFIASYFSCKWKTKNLLLPGGGNHISERSRYGSPGFPEFWKAQGGDIDHQGPQALICFLPTSEDMVLVMLSLLQEPGGIQSACLQGISFVERRCPPQVWNSSGIARIGLLKTCKTKSEQL